MSGKVKKDLSFSYCMSEYQREVRQREAAMGLAWPSQLERTLYFFEEGGFGYFTVAGCCVLPNKSQPTSHNPPTIDCMHGLLVLLVTCQFKIPANLMSTFRFFKTFQYICFLGFVSRKRNVKMLYFVSLEPARLFSNAYFSGME
jgi:hypothetical protein